MLLQGREVETRDYAPERRRLRASGGSRQTRRDVNSVILRPALRVVKNNSSLRNNSL
jgi:hypothetical protein